MFYIDVDVVVLSEPVAEQLAASGFNVTIFEAVRVVRVLLENGLKLGGRGGRRRGRVGGGGGV
ncbi:hypothetical protein BpHYR1_034785 [Brachionus plicatilis]|uniref:Uncharacterized protein n=1 Tax=Brachionus plicatilis TaxID=10195 RepID=A0A3M7S2I1_BRAPC|nr:hypothetical protein BpHYR1_034785 [Brachionus plicatilis]